MRKLTGALERNSILNIWDLQTGLVMSLKDKIINTLASHPRLVTFGIGLAISFAITMVIGMLDHNQMSLDAFAKQSIRQKNMAG